MSENVNNNTVPNNGGQQNGGNNGGAQPVKEGFFTRTKKWFKNHKRNIRDVAIGVVVGAGGTIAGSALGNHLAQKKAEQQLAAMQYQQQDDNNSLDPNVM